MYEPDEIANHLREGSPWHVFMFGDVASTMTEVRTLAAQYPTTDYLVAVAETQSAGLGRHVRHWISSAEGLWMTALMRPSIPPRYAPWFTLAAAVAVAEALIDLGFSVGIKWPNDVLATDEDHWRRKLCGIRCEMELDAAGLAWVSLGIGVNVNHDSFPPEIADRAASLKQLSGGTEVSRARVAAAILDKLENVYATIESDGFTPVRHRWMQHALGLGEKATVRDEDAPDSSGEATGIVRGMDDEGHLLLELNDGSLHTVVAGDLAFQV